MRYLSLFSGIEACTVAWHPLGWRPAAFAEIERAPCQLLADTYPDVPNLGDVSKITDEQITALGHVDLVVGGSPCQDLSVAGKRKGLAGERSGLLHEQVRIFHAARRLCGARWLLWENVPGAFSSNGGRDFAVVVGEMAGAGFGVPGNGWRNTGVAVGENGLVEWCVLDAQWFGVPQRRRRVFALLDTGDWACRPPVLFDTESLRRNPPPSREDGEETSPTLEKRAGRSGTTDFNTSGGLVPVLASGATADWPAQVAPTLNAAFGTKQGLENQHALCGAGLFVPDVIAFHNRQDPDVSGGVTHPIRAKDSGLAIAFKPSHYTRGKDGKPATVAPPLSADADRGDQDTVLAVRKPHVLADYQVRRLTPRECERLQGFPDDYTAGMSDTQRYRALGNSMAVPVMRWIGERINEATSNERRHL